MEQLYVGENRTLDPQKYFIIIVNQLGNGLSSSPHNTPPPWDKANFPRVRIADDVRAQRILLNEEFGINSLELVVGGSMGAQQVYEWSVRFPETVNKKGSRNCWLCQEHRSRFSLYGHTVRSYQIRSKLAKWKLQFSPGRTRWSQTSRKNMVCHGTMP